jgi:hypothetical protein
MKGKSTFGNHLVGCDKSTFMFRFPLFLIVAFAGLLSCVSPLQADELLVSKTGTYKTIQQAINAAQPGDIIKLSTKDGPYYQSTVFHNKSGAEGKPITLDGQGATLDGSDPLDHKEWQEVSPGLYKSTALPMRLHISASILGRYFFLFNNKINRMGRVSKGTQTALKNPADLTDGEWTYVEAEKAFYVRPVAGQDLSSVRAPIRASGVELNGDCEHLVIRNITATHVWNDGFNIHQRSRDILFQNIRAIECGDDGISEHEDCQIKVDGMYSSGNATGFCHVGQSQSDTQNIMIDNCLAYGVYLLDDSHHTLRNCVIRGKSTFAIRLVRNTTLKMDNVLLEDTGPVQIESGASLQAQNVSSWASAWNISKSSVTLNQSAIAGAKLKIDQPTLWKSDHNIFDLQSIIWNGETYDKSTFTDYAADSKQDANSKFQPLERDSIVLGKLLPIGIERKLLPIDGLIF